VLFDNRKSGFWVSPGKAGSNLPATTNTLRTSSEDQGTTQNLQVSSHISSDQGIGVKQAVEGFLLSCKVEGKSYGTIEGYTDKLKGFQWYARNYHWPDNILEITTNHLREFLVYLRESKHRFNSTCLREGAGWFSYFDWRLGIA